MNDIIKQAMIAAFVKQYPLTASKIDENMECFDPIATARRIAAIHAKNACKTPDQKAAMVKYAQLYAEHRLEEIQKYKETTTTISVFSKEDATFVAENFGCAFQTKQERKTNAT